MAILLKSNYTCDSKYKLFLNHCQVKHLINEIYIIYYYNYTVTKSNNS